MRERGDVCVGGGLSILLRQKLSPNSIQPRRFTLPLRFALSKPSLLSSFFSNLAYRLAVLRAQNSPAPIFTVSARIVVLKKNATTQCSVVILRMPLEVMLTSAVAHAVPIM
jgi:hypothetical protein